MNKKGFVLTEVLMVTVFLVTIFIFIYTAIFPLIGKYRYMAERDNNIDIIYKLYSIRKLIKNDYNSVSVTDAPIKKITCNDLDNEEECLELMNYLDLDNYDLMYINNIADNINDSLLNEETRAYLSKHLEDENPTLVLNDKKNHMTVHLTYEALNVMNTFPNALTDYGSSISKIHFRKENGFVIKNKYQNASVKADLTYNNKGKVLSWLEPDSNHHDKYILYIESPGTTYLNTGYYLFSEFNSVEEIIFDNVDTSMVTNMSSMFAYCNNLLTLSLTDFDTSQVVDMNGMFYECYALQLLNLESFNTGNVESMMNMFWKCTSLTYLDLNGFNTSKVTNMRRMFYYCSKITALDLSAFDTSNVLTMVGMFDGCKKIISLNLNNFNTAKVTNMAAMFSFCNSLTEIDISSFNTSKVESMAQMFFDCRALRTLDISNFNISSVNDAHEMFYCCLYLETIYASNTIDFNSVANDSDMFWEVRLIIGGNGTTYNDNYIGKTYARVDSVGTPGYFTLK